MTASYRKAGINLDVPRLHQREIATLRAFDVLACGGVLLVESGTELETLFRAGEEFLTWRTPAERDELVARGIRDPRSFDQVAKAAWSAAASHLLDSRVARILAAFEA
jgi:spore maturation protein CgeB